MIIPKTDLAMWSQKALSQLYWQGIVTVPWVWPKEEVQDFYRHLIQRKFYKGHVVSQGDGIPRTYAEAQTIETTSHQMADVISAPHLFEYAVQFTDFVSAYLGEPPRMYSCNAFWTRPGSSATDPNIQEWHRDRDDRKFLALFMYGSDVLEDEHGPHCFARGSHRNNDQQHRPPREDEPVERVYGKAGTFFFAATAGLHYGVKPRVGERLLAWARWGVSNPPQSYGWDQLKPVPAAQVPVAEVSQAVKDSTRLVVAWQ